MTEPQPTRVPIGEALPGVKIYPLPEGVAPVAVFTLIKVRDADGESPHAEAADWGDDDETRLIVTPTLTRSS
jgi:hypothetical protein